MGQMKVWIEVLQLASQLHLKSLRRFIFLLFLPHFCFSWGRPWSNHAKCYMDGNRIWCLQIVLQHVPICLQQFPSYSNRKCKNRRFHVPQPTFSPLETPLRLSRNNVVWMETPLRLSRNNVVWMERQCNACQTPRSMYLSRFIFNSFRVIRCLIQCVSPKITIFNHNLVSPGDVPWAITLNVVWMEREFDAYKLSRCMCPSNYNRFSDRARYLWKNRHFIIPLAFDALVRWVLVGIPFGVEKLEWWGYPKVKKKLWGYVLPFRHNTGVWQTDGQTDRHLGTA